MFAPIKTALLALSLSLAACSVGAVEGGGTDGGGSGSNEAANRMTFMTVIVPLITECTACHGGTQPILTSYDTLIPKYKMKPGNTNVFVTKGDHSGVTYFTQPEKDMIAAWINGLQ
jgi:hypothetical protein